MRFYRPLNQGPYTLLAVVEELGVPFAWEERISDSIYLLQCFGCNLGYAYEWGVNRVFSSGLATDRNQVLAGDYTCWDLPVLTAKTMQKCMDFHILRGAVNTISFTQDEAWELIRLSAVVIFVKYQGYTSRAVTKSSVVDNVAEYLPEYDKKRLVKYLPIVWRLLTDHGLIQKEKTNG